ncbi:hypothetical protein ACFFX0_05380 [Citricoccus parietis]|uniref:Uncharacterized protein n=1 Tax=Citricoccus parietis TaxID=592307 RepID=A0ABV5FVD7_9MICC
MAFSAKDRPATSSTNTAKAEVRAMLRRRRRFRRATFFTWCSASRERSRLMVTVWYPLRPAGRTMTGVPSVVRRSAGPPADSACGYSRRSSSRPASCSDRRASSRRRSSRRVSGDCGFRGSSGVGSSGVRSATCPVLSLWSFWRRN